MHANIIWLVENVTEWQEPRKYVARSSKDIALWSDHAVLANSLSKEEWTNACWALYWDSIRKVVEERKVKKSEDVSQNTKITAWQSEQDSRAKVHPDTHNENPFTTPEEDEAWDEAERRMEAIGQNGNDGDHYDLGPDKQARYQDAEGEDWIDEAARTFTAEEFRGAMRFTIGKYNRRMGKKDDLISEIEKIRDYATRWLEVEQGR